MRITGKIDSYNFVAIGTDGENVSFDVDDDVITLEDLSVRKEFHPIDGHHRNIEASEGIFETYLVLNYLSDLYNIEFDEISQDLLDKLKTSADGRMNVVE